MAPLQPRVSGRESGAVDGRTTCCEQGNFDNAGARRRLDVVVARREGLVRVRALAVLPVHPLDQIGVGRANEPVEPLEELALLPEGHLSCAVLVDEFVVQRTPFDGRRIHQLLHPA